MAKYKFTKEYDFRASAKMLYPYFSTVQGLSEWFVDKVWVDNENVYHFEWQGEPLKAMMKLHKINTFVKYEFFPKAEVNGKEALNYVDFHLNPDEMTGDTYVKVTDFSEMDDEIELNEMWDSFIATLKEKVGG
ncbi:MAG: START-like domain-containing protein [Cytophagales bacterium]